MRKALVVGIDHYEYTTNLNGCVNDAEAVAKALKYHGDRDGSKNFEVRELLAPNVKDGGEPYVIKKRVLRDQIKALFAGELQTALLYFAGHGYADETGGFLYTGDSETGDAGFLRRAQRGRGTVDESCRR